MTHVGLLNVTQLPVTTALLSEQLLQSNSIKLNSATVGFICSHIFYPNIGHKFGIKKRERLILCPFGFLVT
jgi:hypothetical protein